MKTTIRLRTAHTQLVVIKPICQLSTFANRNWMPINSYSIRFLYKCLCGQRWYTNYNAPVKLISVKRKNSLFTPDGVKAYVALIGLLARIVGLMQWCNDPYSLLDSRPSCYVLMMHIFHFHWLQTINLHSTKLVINYSMVCMKKVNNMDEIQKLEYLSLVSKICTELDNHYGLNDKDLGNWMLLSFSSLTEWVCWLVMVELCDLPDIYKRFFSPPNSPKPPQSWR